ncbi:MAG: PKD domain-containing protein [Deltaproteobacteria bacterium]|nr:PKD domain-containing protein [Deltaproteobacteria bacterium]
MTYTWDFGDGTPTKTGRVQGHTYAKSGFYTDTLTLNLNDGTTLGICLPKIGLRPTPSRCR